MSQADGRTVALADRFEFVERMKRSQRLPPRGQFRVIAADVRGPFSNKPSNKSSNKSPSKFPHTLFFSSLLAAPLYHELIAAHYTLPANGKHGPFNVAEMTPADFVSIDAATFRRRVEEHLDYRRYGAARIAPERRQNVTDFVDVLAAQAFDIFALSPCDWFSNPANSRYPHEWSHSLLEFHEYVLFDTLHRKLLCVMFAFD